MRLLSSGAAARNKSARNACQRYIDSQVSYHEQMCGTGIEVSLIRRAWHAGRSFEKKRAFKQRKRK